MTFLKIPKKRSKSKISVHVRAKILRARMTPAEKYFWERLRKRQQGWRHQFKPQCVVHGYIPDFYCDTLKLAVEIDGRIHDRKDVKRNDTLRTKRFRNRHVFSNCYQLLSQLETVCE
jgi:very-short-patch-repair endonuclease